MKMTIEVNDNIYQTIIKSDEQDIYEMFEIFKGLIISVGYHQNSFAKGCEYMLEQLEKSEGLENE